MRSTTPARRATVSRSSWMTSDPRDVTYTFQFQRYGVPKITEDTFVHEWRVAPANVCALDEPLRSGQSRLHPNHARGAVGFQRHRWPPLFQEHERQWPALRYGRVRALRRRHADESVQYGVPLDEGRPDHSRQPDRPGEPGHHSGARLDRQSRRPPAGGRRGHPGAAAARGRSRPLSAQCGVRRRGMGEGLSKRNRGARPICITWCPTTWPFPAITGRCQTPTR